MSDPAGVEAVLAEHATYAPEWDEERTTTGGGVYWRYRCKCGELLPTVGFAAQKHRAHLAAALTPLFAERERAALREAAYHFGVIWGSGVITETKVAEVLKRWAEHGIGARPADALAQKVPQGSQEGTGGSNTRSVALRDADDENEAQNGADEEDA